MYATFLIITLRLLLSPARFQHFRYLHIIYPPIWLTAALLATVLLLVADRLYAPVRASPVDFSIWLELLAAQALAVFVCALVPFFSSIMKQEIVLEKPAPQSSDDKWRTWIWNEKPVTKPDDDKFGFAATAAEVAAQLVHEFGKDLTVGIIGKFGCGKSSIISFIDYYCNPVDRIDINTDDKNQAAATGSYRRC